MSFPSLIKDSDDNLFSQIHLHNTNAFLEDLTGKNFYNLAYKFHFYILIFKHCTNKQYLHKSSCNMMWRQFQCVFYGFNILLCEKICYKKDT